MHGFYSGPRILTGMCEPLESFPGKGIVSWGSLSGTKLLVLRLKGFPDVMPREFDIYLVNNQGI